MEYFIVQAGGKGTRLKQLTENKPKALVPVDNLPMLFHLFRKYPQKRFVIIADYKKDVMRKYLAAFADVKYQVVDAAGTGTCGGINQALRLIPEGEPFMLIWSDLILPIEFDLPRGYADGWEGMPPKDNYVGISHDFPCRWSFNVEFKEEASCEFGVAGVFLFPDKNLLRGLPDSGEFVRWLQEKGCRFKEWSVAGTREFGLINEYMKLTDSKCRPFNKITVEGDVLIKEPLDEQGAELAKRECLWYEKACSMGIDILPRIYGTNPLKMEFIKGKNIYECNLSKESKTHILEQLVNSLKRLHAMEKAPVDTFSIKEGYYAKTIGRLNQIRDMVPFADEKYITVNGRRCRNVYYYQKELEQALEKLNDTAQPFAFTHGDCTFSNMMLRENGEPVLIDPRGYFGFTEMYGDIRYDWGKMYYSLVGNYDSFNLRKFRLHIGDNAEEGVKLEVDSNHWDDMEDKFFELTGANRWEIKIIHAVIWLSLTTYVWHDYDSICGAYYNGLYYLEEVL
ncbi:MAG: phosphotransferase [Selenomonadaceae bacterium]|nr:phosphotransferase [Selenomonadaceae bacterium]